MKRIISTILVAVLFSNNNFTAQQINKKNTILPMNTSNPLLRKSNLQFQAPEFDKIKNEHFKPAFDLGLKEHNDEILAIANNPAKPTFENTILALEKSGELLKRARLIFGNLTSANTNPSLQALDQEYSAIFAGHNDKIYLNEKLYKRVKAVNDKNLDSESKRLLALYIQNFELAGAGLSASKKEELKQINQKLATLESQFEMKLLEARKNGGLLVDTAEELDGLSPDQIEKAKKDAEQIGNSGKYLLQITNTTQQPYLAVLKNRKTREKLFNASWTRAEKGDSADTQNLVKEIANLRLKKAQLLGKKSFAEWKLQDQMAQTPANAMDLMHKIATPAIEGAKKEKTEIQKLINSQNENFEVQPWDWDFYAEQVRKEKFNLNENEIKPYFDAFVVLEKGVFYAANKFYGITFKKRTDIPTYHPDVIVYEIFDTDGKSLALCYFDFWTRDSKRGGAWMNNFVEQSSLFGTKPVITTCFNYIKPEEGKPALINFDEVETIFHEFGHALHGIFANQKYASLSGTNVPRDFVEFPSQFNEHFALEPEILKNYAIHYETKQSIPQSLVEKIKKASTFNQGYATTELVSSAILDMMWHSIEKTSTIKSVLDFEKQALTKNGFILNAVPPRYHTPYFAHIWGGGYSAGYYAYLWSETMDVDAWDYFKNNGGFTRENGDKYRKYILSVGNSVDLNKSYIQLTGRKSSVNALLEMKGLKK